MWLHCGIAALGDGVVVVAIYLIGRATFQRDDWFDRPKAPGYILMLVAGAGIAIIIEWLAVHVAHRWAYTADMPLVPGLGIGLVPILQMLFLPPVIFRTLSWWRRETGDR